MAAEPYVKMIDATFKHFGALGKWYEDPAGVEAVRQVRDRMVADLSAFKVDPSAAEMAELCRQWRTLRIAPEGPAEYPPDMFIESVCQVIELV